MTRSTAKHVPLRRCVVCRASLPKAELIRLVKTEDGRFQVDPSRRAGGRGTWVCHRCAEDPAEKRLKQAFRGQSTHVRTLLARAVGSDEPDVHENTPRPRHRDGGMNVR